MASDNFMCLPLCLSVCICHNLDLGFIFNKVGPHHGIPWRRTVKGGSVKLKSLVTFLKVETDLVLYLKRSFSREAL